jgi:hypothetical protein
MKITTPNTNFGFYGWNATAEVSDNLMVVLAGLGLLQLLQRSPATEAEKTLAKYEKRPKGFQRSSIEHNPTNEGIFKKIMSKALEITQGEEGKEGYAKHSITPLINTWYHPLGATAEPVYAEEKKIILRHINDKKDVVTWATDTVGFTGAGDLDTENLEFLKAVKAWKSEMLANA